MSQKKKRRKSKSWTIERTRKQLEDEADHIAKKFFGVESRIEAFRLLDQGHLHGTIAEAELKGLRFLLEYGETSSSNSNKK